MHDTTDATVATSLLVDFLGFLGRRGLAQDRVILAARLDPAWISTPPERLPALAMERLWAAAEQLTGDADLGLHSAEGYNPGALGILGYVLLSCATAAQALERLARYAPLLNEGLQVQLLTEGDQTLCRFGAAPGRSSFLQHSPRQAVETLAAGIVLTLQRLATRPPQPLAVHFQHAAPASVAEHHRLLGPVVLFGQAHNQVGYASAALQAPLLSADPGLLAMFEGDAARRLQALASQATLRGRALAVVAARLKGRVPDLAEVAAALALSERSLQRGLQAEGCAYREIVDEVRRTLALAHLARPGSTATDVAFLLGFSEPSAFSRAFRRWTGVAPSQYQRLGSGGQLTPR
jgi:AraC-like DNA-binding protein